MQQPETRLDVTSISDASLVEDVGMCKFTYRLDQLHSLVDLWTRNDEQVAVVQIHNSDDTSDVAVYCCERL